MKTTLPSPSFATPSIAEAMPQSSTPSPEAGVGTAPLRLPPDVEALLCTALGCLARHRTSGPIKLKALEDYLKLIDGASFRSIAVDNDFRKAVQSVLDRSADQALHSDVAWHVRTMLFAAIYVALCQRNAYLPDGTFDCAGLSLFLRYWLSTRPSQSIPFRALQDGSRHDIDALLRSSTSLEVRPPAQGAARFYRTETLFSVDTDRSGPSPIGRIDTSGREICTKGFRAAYLARASLDFTGHSYHKADMSDAVLFGAHLKNGTLRKAKLDHTNLADARLESMVLEECVIINAVLKNVAFDHCTLRRCRFIDCDMTEAQFLSGMILDTTFENCCWRGGRMGSLIGLANQPHRGRPAKMRMAVYGTAFSACNLGGLRAESIHFDDCEFSTPCHIGRLSRATFTDCHFGGCDFRHCDTSHTRFRDTSFLNSTFVSADFSSSRGAALFDASNDISRLRCADAILEIDAHVLARLNKPEGRAIELDPASPSQCLLRRTLDLPGEVRTPLLAKVVKHLVRLAQGGRDISDTDASLLPILCRPPHDDDGSISAFLDWRLGQRLAQFNTSGLSLSVVHRPHWHLRAAPRLAQHLVRLTNPATIREFSPLICQLRAASCLKLIALDDDLDAKLTALHQGACPESLWLAYCDVSGCDVSDREAQRSTRTPDLMMITRDARSAVVLPPSTWKSLLAPDTGESGIAAPLELFSFIPEGDAYVCIVQAPIQACRFFPLLAAWLASDGNESKERLLALYRLPDHLHLAFHEAMVTGKASNLLADDVQLAKTFFPLLTTRNAMPTDFVEAREVMLKPAHRARLVTAFLHVRDGTIDTEREANFLLLISQIFYRAASASVFGNELDSPLSLRHYAWASFNSAYRIAPAPFISATSARKIAEQTYGLRTGVASCAAIIADTVREMRAARPCTDARVVNALLPYLW